jgi:hypothetical protein
MFGRLVILAYLYSRVELKVKLNLTNESGWKGAPVISLVILQIKLLVFFVLSMAQMKPLGT